MPSVPGSSKKDKPHPILFILRLLFLATLLAAAGIDWYIVYLLARDETDFGRVRKFAGIAGGFTLGLVVVILLIVVVLFFTGGAALLFKKGLLSAQGFYAITVFVFIICVAGINFAIMPIAKNLANTDVTEANADDSFDKAKIRKLAIAGAGFGTGIVAVYFFYYAARGYFASKKTGKKDSKSHGASSSGGLGNRKDPVVEAPVSSGPNPAQVTAAKQAQADAAQQAKVKQAQAEAKQDARLKAAQEDALVASAKRKIEATGASNLDEYTKVLTPEELEAASSSTRLFAQLANEPPPYVP